jgi:very-short-patch-repair endonuclease
MNLKVINRNMFYGASSETFAAAHQLRRNMTRAEIILWQKLKDKKLFGIKFRRQHPINIFIVDFYNHAFKLVIEIDGEIHNEKDKIEYDINRTSELERYGLRILCFTNSEVIFHIDSVLLKIQMMVTELGPL